MSSKLAQFHKIVREERLFCSILFHLLLASPTNVQTFVRLVNRELQPSEAIEAPDADPQLYIEFTYLRDTWYAFGRGAEANALKRQMIFELFGRSPILRELEASEFPTAPSEFNARFMGERGARISADIVNPGQWSVGALGETFGENADMFRELCRVKWSFNIKPDLVIIPTSGTVICVEAKLESSEGFYPTNNVECAIFDRLCGFGNRVRQVELQQYMFEVLLGTPCQTVIVERTAHARNGVPSLAWKPLFAALDSAPSSGFLSRLIAENEVLDRRTPEAEIPPDNA